MANLMRYAAIKGPEGTKLVAHSLGGWVRYLEAAKAISDQRARIGSLTQQLNKKAEVCDQLKDGLTEAYAERAALKQQLETLAAAGIDDRLQLALDDALAEADEVGSLTAERLRELFGPYLPGPEALFL